MSAFHECPNCGATLKTSVVGQKRKAGRSSNGQYQSTAQSIDGDLPSNTLWGLSDPNCGVTLTPMGRLKTEAEVETLLEWRQGRRMLRCFIPITPAEIRSIMLMLGSGGTWSRVNVCSSSTISQGTYADLSERLEKAGLLASDNRGGQGAMKLTHDGVTVLRHYGGLRVEPTAF